MTRHAARYHILIPVFNRREITLHCLAQLKPLARNPDWKICVIDDGSTDGTAGAISSTFPETEVLAGDGNLYWNGAMEMGMRYAIREGSDCCVWLNDDLSTTVGAFEAIVAVALQSKAVVTAQGIVQHDNRPPYYFPGLYRGKYHLQTRDLNQKSFEAVPVDCCRGNLVAIPRNVVETIGYPDGKNIPHVSGDPDYTLRATAAGIPCLTLVSALFYEKEIVRDDNRSWLLDDRSPSEIWKSTISRRSAFYPRSFWTYQLRHWGWRGFLNCVFGYGKLMIILALKIMIPKAILLKFYAHRSHAYRVYQGIEKSS